MKNKIEALNFNNDFQHCLNDDKKVYWINSFDENFEIYSRTKIKEKVTDKVELIEGKEVNSSWIEDRFYALGFFNEITTFFILNANHIQANLLEDLLQAAFQSEHRLYLFTTGLREDKKTKEIFEQDEISFIQVTAPLFWEMERFIQAFFSWEGILINKDAAQFLSMRLGQGFAAIENALRIIKLNFLEQKEVSLSELKEIFLSNTHIDRFLLADHFNQKKMTLFFDELLLTDVNPDEFKSFFSFMVNHCVKIVDPNYIPANKKPSKYDQAILRAREGWDDKQLDFMIEKFSEFTILCKQKKTIENDLRELKVLFSKRGL